MPDREQKRDLDRTDPRPSRPRRARLLGLFLLGLVLLNPPLLGVFRTPEMVMGIPPLLLYLFGIWGMIVIAFALIVERRDG